MPNKYIAKYIYIYIYINIYIYNIYIYVYIILYLNMLHYTCIFMNKMEISFLKTQQMQPFTWLRYIDDNFYMDTW